ncbi:MAG TPA: sensor histidine kinase [Geodermatophilus sp.]|nr:sensor histidine kinase [Geodermatophilus sp.]
MNSLLDSPVEGFAHEAFLYREDEDFLAGVLPFVREGLARDEIVVVAEPPARLALVRDALAEDAAAVELLDMTEIGANPGRIISVWAAVVDRALAAGRGLRGIGEPAFPERSAAELVECRIHELLLNTAFDGGPAWRLLCPYDEQRLPRTVTAGALVTHPLLTTPAGVTPSAEHFSAMPTDALGDPLPPPTDIVLRGEYRAGDVPAVRRTVGQYARSAGLPDEKVEVLQLAASELATNSIRHGGGGGTLAMWSVPDAVVVEFSDTGRIDDPLVGRRMPPPSQEGGRGVYLVHQLCDLVAVRSTPAGTAVRVTTWR